MTETGGAWALLHHADAIAEGLARSDADVVAAGSVGAIVRALREPLRRRSLALVMVWPYDIGSASLFVVRRDRPGGAQVDITVDARGRGAYGLRAPAFLDRATAGSRWPMVDPLDGLVYRVVKRSRKAEPVALATVVQEARAADRALLLRRSRDLLAPRTARAVEDALAGASAREGRRRSPAALARLVGRVRHRVGVWVHADQELGMPEAAGAFAEVVPIVHLTSPASVAEIARLRYRAALVFTAGDLRTVLRPDLRFESLRYTALVDALERRVALRWGDR